VTRLAHGASTDAQHAALPELFATTVLFIGSVFTPWAIVWGSIPVVAALTAWFWPTHRENAGAVALEREP
jgi:hypothetical protein